MEVSLYKLAVGNLATDNRFICLIPRLPGAVPLFNLQFLVSECPIPEQKDVNVKVYMFGREGEMPINTQTNGDAKIKIESDANLILYNQFLIARDFVVNKSTGIVSSWKDIVFDFYVTHLNDKKVPVKKWVYQSCYLSEVGSWGYKKQGNDKIEFDVTIKYDNWRFINI